MFFNKLYDRLDKIEDNQVRFSKALDRISPMVEEYHATKLVKKNIGEKFKYYGIIIGLVIAVVSLGDTFINKVSGDNDLKAKESTIERHLK